MSEREISLDDKLGNQVNRGYICNMRDFVQCSLLSDKQIQVMDWPAPQTDLNFRGFLCVAKPHSLIALC